MAEEELPPEERGLPPAARRRRRWVPWAVLAVVAALVIAGLAAWQAGLFRGPQGPEVTGVAADTESPAVGQTLTLSAVARDPAGGNLTYFWDFGDGTNATTSEPRTTHAYELPGDFIVLLTVRNRAGLTATNDRNLTFVKVQAPEVKAPTGPGPGGAPAPVAVAAVDDQVPPPNKVVNFNGNSSWQWTWTGSDWAIDTTVIQTYRWNFGDGSPEMSGNLTTGANANHSYAREGNWFTRLTVENPNGSSSYGLTIRVVRQAGPIVKNPTVFNTVTFGEPDFLDPAVDYETSGAEVIQNVYETPVFYKGNSTEELIPLLATQVPSLENGLIGADGTTYNWPIRANVTFHNGDPLTLDDVVYSWQRPLIIHDPNGPAWMMDLALFNYMITNFNGKPTGDYLDSLRSSNITPPAWLTGALAGHPTVDEGAVRAALNAAIFVNTSAAAPPGSLGVVTVRLVRPYPAFVKIAAFPILSVVDKKVVEANGGTQWEQQNPWMNDHAVGTGPFKLRAWQRNQVIILDRFDQYWRGPAKLRQVNIIKVQDITTRELMLFSGQADYAVIPRNHQYDVMDRSGTPRPGLLIDRDRPTLIVNFIGFNQAIVKNPSIDSFTDVPSDFFAGPPGSSGWHVRRAFSYAFDYDTFVRDVLFGGGTRLYGPIPQGMFGWTQTNLFQFNLDLARAELRNASAPGGGNWLDRGFKLQVFYNAGNLVREQGSLLLKKNLEALNPGKIQVNVQTLDWPVYLSTVRARVPALFFLGWAPDYADPDDYVTPFLHSTAGTFPINIGFKDPQLDRLIEQAASTVDVGQRAALYAQIQKIAYEQDVPYIWTHQATSFTPLRDWVKGFVFNPMFGGLYYYDLSKGR